MMASPNLTGPFHIYLGSVGHHQTPRFHYYHASNAPSVAVEAAGLLYAARLLNGARINALVAAVLFMRHVDLGYVPASLGTFPRL
jgi:hypothetical protein